MSSDIIGKNNTNRTYEKVSGYREFLPCEEKAATVAGISEAEKGKQVIDESNEQQAALSSEFSANQGMCIHGVSH